MIKVFGLVDDCRRTNALAIIVDEDVAHNREDPSLEVDILDIFLLIVESFQRGVLEQIVSVVAIRSQQISKVQQVALQTEKLGLKFFRTYN